jgi:hypothetical protein
MQEKHRAPGRRKLGGADIEAKYSESRGSDRNSKLLFDLPVEESLNWVGGIGIVTLVSTVADER